MVPKFGDRPIVIIEQGGIAKKLSMTSTGQLIT